MRHKRTKAQMEELREAIHAFATAQQPVTVRQTFYHLVGLKLVDKTETEYDRCVGRLMKEMREDGRLPWEWVSDETRINRAPNVYTSPAEAMEDAARLYRKNAWATQPRAIEVWCEKEALAGVIIDETYDIGVPLLINKGYGSATYIHDAAMRIDARARNLGQPTTLLYFGDHDPSGADMSRDLQSRLERYVETEFADGRPTWEFVRVALNETDIKTYGLPTRPTKGKDPRARGTNAFVGDSVDLDALPPSDLRALVRDAIATRMDREAYDQVLVAEESERAILGRIASAMKADQ